MLVLLLSPSCSPNIGGLWFLRYSPASHLFAAKCVVGVSADHASENARDTGENVPKLGRSKFWIWQAGAPMAKKYEN